MSPTGIGLIAFVIVLSGLLSYYGDVLGRKLGKKRLTLGRLRPRHTAAMMTGLFGMIGSGLAIGILMLFARPVRVMLLEGDRLTAKIVNQQKELKSLQAELNSKQVQLGLEQKNVEIEKGKVSKERANLLIARKDLGGLRKLTTDLKKQATKVRSDLANVRKQLAALKPQYNKLKSEYASVDRQLKGSSAELEKIGHQNMELMVANGEAEKKLKANTEKIAELSGTIKSLETKLFEQSTQANKELLELRTQVEEAKQQVDAARSDLDRTKAEYDRTNENLKKLLSASATVSRTQPLIFSRGDELARIPVRSKLNTTESRSYVLAIVGNSSSTAAARGAKAIPPSTSAAVLASLSDSKNNALSEDEKVNTFAHIIEGKNNEQVLIASALFNSFQGEPVPILLQVRPNPIVYKQNQLILETKIDGQMPEDQIVESISQFVQDKLGPKAIKDGLIPAVGLSQPLGEIPQDALLNLVKEIKQVNRTIRVQFLAVQDTRAADQLKLRFVLK